VSGVICAQGMSNLLPPDYYDPASPRIPDCPLPGNPVAGDADGSWRGAPFLGLPRLSPDSPPGPVLAFMGSEDLLDIQEAARPVMGFCEAVLPLRNFTPALQKKGCRTGFQARPFLCEASSEVCGWISPFVRSGNRRRNTVSYWKGRAWKPQFFRAEWREYRQGSPCCRLSRGRAIELPSSRWPRSQSEEWVLFWNIREDARIVRTSRPSRPLAASREPGQWGSFAFGGTTAHGNRGTTCQRLGGDL